MKPSLAMFEKDYVPRFPFVKASRGHFLIWAPAVCEIWWVHLEYKNNRVRQFLEPADKYLLCQGIERMTFEMCKTATNHTLSQSRNSIISFHFNSFLHSCTSTTKLNRSFFLPRRSVQAKSQSDPS